MPSACSFRVGRPETYRIDVVEFLVADTRVTSYLDVCWCHCAVLVKAAMHWQRLRRAEDRGRERQGDRDDGGEGVKREVRCMTWECIMQCGVLSLSRVKRARERTQ